MSETRKIAAILVSDVVGYSRLAGADEERTLARLRALRSDLIDPTVALHHGRVVKRTGDGAKANLNGSWAKYGVWAERVVTCAKELAKYQSPQLRAIAVAPVPQNDDT